MQGRSLSEFVATTLQDAARRTLEENAIWMLSQEQQWVFIEALANPPEPNDRLRAAQDRYTEYRASLPGESR